MSQKESVSEKIERLKLEVEWFYGDSFDLTKAIVKYTEATKLAKEIEVDLGELKNEIKIIGENFAS